MAELSMDLKTAGAIPGQSPDSANRLEQNQRQQVISVVEDVKERPQEQQAEVDRESVAEMIDEMNQSKAIRSTSLQFVFEERSEPPIVKVLDTDSGEMIRQIPSELAVKLAKAIEEMADNEEGNTSGFLFDKQV